MPNTRSSPAPTLDSVTRAFDIWRRERSAPAPTPAGLRHQAVALLRSHKPFHICKALGVHADALKRWQASLNDEDALVNATPRTPTPAPASFVALPPTCDAAETIAHGDNCRVTFELADGVRADVLAGVAAVAELITRLNTAVSQ